VTTTWIYDPAGQPGVTHSAPDGRPLSVWANSFDSEGNLVRSEHRHGTETEPAVDQFDYDHLGRLISAHTTEGLTEFFWDSASNRVAVSGEDRRGGRSAWVLWRSGRAGRERWTARHAGSAVRPCPRAFHQS
jgi:YD repeat-containing protein